MQSASIPNFPTAIANPGATNVAPQSSNATPTDPEQSFAPMVHAAMDRVNGQNENSPSHAPSDTASKTIAGSQSFLRPATSVNRKSDLPSKQGRPAAPASISISAVLPQPLPAAPLPPTQLAIPASSSGADPSPTSTNAVTAIATDDASDEVVAKTQPLGSNALSAPSLTSAPAGGKAETVNSLTSQESAEIDPLQAIGLLSTNTTNSASTTAPKFTSESDGPPTTTPPPSHAASTSATKPLALPDSVAVVANSLTNETTTFASPAADSQAPKTSSTYPTSSPTPNDPSPSLSSDPADQTNWPVLFNTAYASAIVGSSSSSDNSNSKTSAAPTQIAKPNSVQTAQQFAASAASKVLAVPDAPPDLRSAAELNNKSSDPPTPPVPSSPASPRNPVQSVADKSFPQATNSAHTNPAHTNLPDPTDSLFSHKPPAAKAISQLTEPYSLAAQPSKQTPNISGAAKSFVATSTTTANTKSPTSESQSSGSDAQAAKPTRAATHDSNDANSPATSSDNNSAALTNSLAAIKPDATALLHQATAPSQIPVPTNLQNSNATNSPQSFNTTRTSEPAQQSSTSPDPTAATNFVKTAQLTQNPSQTEMRISMNSDQLGSVEVRAHTQGAEIGAAITVERRDAHTALALELPALQQSLADKHLPVPRVVLTQGSLGTNTGAHSQAQQNPGQSRHQDPRNSAFHQYFSAGSTTTLPATSILSIEPAPLFNSQGRLNVRA